MGISLRRRHTDVSKYNMRYTRGSTEVAEDKERERNRETEAKSCHATIAAVSLSNTVDTPRQSFQVFFYRRIPSAFFNARARVRDNSHAHE